MRYFQLLLSVALLLAVVSCGKKTDNAAETAHKPLALTDTMMKRCTIVPVRKEPVQKEMRLFGKIVADYNKVAQVYPLFGGSVVSIKVELGDYVRQNQVLAVLHSGEVAELEKELLDAKNDLAAAESHLQSARELFSGKLNTEKDVVAATSQVEKARNELTRINEVYAIYRLKGGSEYQITAPISGFIIQKDINQNEQLRADKTDLIFSIAEINDVWMLANVNETDISKIQLGYEARVKTLSFPDEVYAGKVDKIFSNIDPETKTMKIRVKLPNPGMKLKPEMNAILLLNFQEPAEKVAVPSEAVIFDKSKYWVVVYQGRDQLEKREVSLYAHTDQTTYLQTGLNGGEQIIVKQALMVYDALESHANS